MSEIIIQSSDLFFCGGGSDKEYHAQLVEVSGGCVVRFQYGRRGAALASGTKTAAPVERIAAQKIFDRLVSEKTSKGYQVDAGQGVAYVSSSTSTATKSDGLIPQLLNPIDEASLERYLRDDMYGAQEKKDGRHQMARYKDASLTVYNKKGKEIGYPQQWLGSLNVPVVLDGEAIGETFHVFDLLEALGTDYRGRGYGERHAKLATMSFGSSISVVPLAIGYAAKRALYDKLVAGKKEGIVFKRLDAVYVPGRPSSLGDMLKFKFYAEASVLVAQGRAGKHSFGMEIFDGAGQLVSIGNCTVGQSTPLPPLNSVAEVRYLYAYKGGSLYQPSYKGPRHDVDACECVISQLKYKPEDE